MGNKRMLATSHSNIVQINNSFECRFSPENRSNFRRHSNNSSTLYLHVVNWPNAIHVHSIVWLRCPLSNVGNVLHEKWFVVFSLCLHFCSDRGLCVEHQNAFYNRSHSSKKAILSMCICECDFGRKTNFSTLRKLFVRLIL